MTPTCILHDEALTKLTSLHRPLTAASIKNYLQPNWVFWPKYGPELCRLLLELQDEENPPQSVFTPAVPSQSASAHGTDSMTAPDPPMSSSAYATTLSKRPRQTLATTSLSVDTGAIPVPSTSTSCKRARPTPRSNSMVPLAAPVVGGVPSQSHYQDHCVYTTVTHPPPTMPLPPSSHPFNIYTHGNSWTNSPYYSYTASSFGPPHPSPAVPQPSYTPWGQHHMMTPSSWHPFVPHAAPTPPSVPSQGATEPPGASFNLKDTADAK